MYCAICCHKGALYITVFVFTASTGFFAAHSVPFVISTLLNLVRIQSFTTLNFCPADALK